jgi:signal transduction histidine kinase
MRLGIKAKQVVGVTAIVGVTVTLLSVFQLAGLAQVRLDESRARAELLAKAIFQRAREAVRDGDDPAAALRADSGLRSILESSSYSDTVTFAAIVDHQGQAIVEFPPREGAPLPASENIETLLAKSPIAQLREVYRGQGRNFELSQPLLIGDVTFGSIRIGISTLLVRGDLDQALRPAAITALVALGLAIVGATILAQLLLRPIHVIRSGLTRLGQGEFGVRLDLQQQDEFGELGTFFNAVSAQLSADRSQMAGHVASLESAVDHLEDAVAMVSGSGEVLFANPAMQTLMPRAAEGARLDALVPDDHPLRKLAAETLVTRRSSGPVSVSFTLPSGEATERTLLAHPVEGPDDALVGIMLIVRNLEYLSRVQTSVRYSRKLAALGRLSAGVAHEVKNPLNAMMIHLELLRQHVAPRQAVGARAGAAATGSSPGLPDALPHVDVIAGEIRRLDEVVQGFLKFTRPEDLKLQSVALAVLFDEVIPIIRPEAERSGVALQVECDGALAVNGDSAMLRQAFLNLALNACQAMPEGGTLRIACHPPRGGRVLIEVADTGVGIKPEHLGRIFDLYFSTKPKGSGIGLSMVFRTIQMHDGEIEVQSILGKGTTFRILLPQAS